MRQHALCGKNPIKLSETIRIKNPTNPKITFANPCRPQKPYELFISTTEKSIPVPAAARILRQRAVSERFCSPMLSITREERGFGSFAEAERPQRYALFKTIVSALAKQYSTSREELPAAIRKQADELASSKSELREKSRRLASAESVSLLSTAERIKGIAVVCSVMDGSTANDLKLTADELCKKDSTVPCVSLLFAPNAGGTDYCMACTEDAAIKLSMRELCTAVNCIMNGKGGGNQLLARGKTTRTVQKSDCDMLRSYIEKVLKS